MSEKFRNFLCRQICFLSFYGRIGKIRIVDCRHQLPDGEYRKFLVWRKIHPKIYFGCFPLKFGCLHPSIVSKEGAESALPISQSKSQC